MTTDPREPADIEAENAPDKTDSEAEVEAEATAAGTEREVDDSAEAAVESAEDELRQLLLDAETEMERHREAVLREKAEMDNLRKRLSRELEKAHKYALEKFMAALLPVRDSLERGLEAAQGCDSVDTLREGKELTLKMLTKAMQDHGLEIIDPQGEVFDPEWHEAMSMQPSDEVEPNTVITVIQKGFKLNDRIIRPAMVIISSDGD